MWTPTLTYNWTRGRSQDRHRFPTLESWMGRQDAAGTLVPVTPPRLAERDEPTQARFSSRQQPTTDANDPGLLEIGSYAREKLSQDLVPQGRLLCRAKRGKHQVDQPLFAALVWLELEVGLADQSRAGSVGQEVGQLQVKWLTLPAPGPADDECESSPSGCKRNKELPASHFRAPLTFASGL